MRSSASSQIRSSSRPGTRQSGRSGRRAERDGGGLDVQDGTRATRQERPKRALPPSAATSSASVPLTLTGAGRPDALGLEAARAAVADIANDADFVSLAAVRKPEDVGFNEAGRATATRHRGLQCGHRGGAVARRRAAARATRDLGELLRRVGGPVNDEHGDPEASAEAARVRPCPMWTCADSARWSGRFGRCPARGCR
jgi:hypothetical protein